MNNVLEALRGDFKLFLQALWDQLDLPSPTRAQYAIADYLQHGPKRLQIQAFRGVGKSWITGAFVLWTLFKDPEKKIMIISIEWCKKLFPNQNIKISAQVYALDFYRNLGFKTIGKEYLEDDIPHMSMILQGLNSSQVK